MFRIINFLKALKIASVDENTNNGFNSNHKENLNSKKFQIIQVPKIWDWRIPHDNPDKNTDQSLPLCIVGRFQSPLNLSNLSGELSKLETRTRKGVNINNYYISDIQEWQQMKLKMIHCIL